MKTIFDYENRATRKELGIFILFTFLVPVLFTSGLLILDNEIEIFESAKLKNFLFIPMFLGYLTTIICLPFIIIKRLHDVGKNGWNIFLPLIPVIGAIWFLYLMLSNSQKSDNEYGKYNHIEK